MRDEHLQKKGPQTVFRSPRQEAAIGLLIAADRVHRYLTTVVEPYGVTLQQYNVLRILRGAGEPLPTLAIVERMFEQAPGVSRLLDRLEAKGLVTRERSAEDRRIILCALTPAARQLLAQMDEPVDAADESALNMLDDDEIQRLLPLLRSIHKEMA